MYMWRAFSFLVALAKVNIPMSPVLMFYNQLVGSLALDFVPCYCVEQSIFVVTRRHLVFSFICAIRLLTLTPCVLCVAMVVPIRWHNTHSTRLVLSLLLCSPALRSDFFSFSIPLNSNEKHHVVVILTAAQNEMNGCRRSTTVRLITVLSKSYS